MRDKTYHAYLDSHERQIVIHMNNKFDEQNDTVKFQLLNLLIFYHRHT